MPQFFASTAMGLAEALELELQGLGFTHTERIASGVFFETNWAGCYKANLHSRLASRILKPILDFPAYDAEQLYFNIRKHDFTKYIRPEQTLKIESQITDCAIRDQRFVSMKVKDAIADQFREKYEIRPSIDNMFPDLRVHVKAVRDQYHVLVDTSGESLFQRGYRREAGEAPLKENLAAGLLSLSGWDAKSPLIDPTCGSGTFLIEAAMKALNIAPGLMRRGFGFQKLLGFDKVAWDQVVQEAVDQELEDLDFKLYGYDIDRGVLRAAKENARRAGVDHVIEFKSESITTLVPPVEKGMIISNPPYGARLGEEDLLRDVYRDFGHTLKHNFKGWDAWILSGNKDLIMDLKLKATRRHFVYNGPLECRFLKYSMF